MSSRVTRLELTQVLIGKIAKLLLTVVLGGFIKTIRLIKRLGREMPQPARALSWMVPSTFLLGFLLVALTGEPWTIRIAVAAAGVALVLLGFCVYRDVNGAATTWSRLYKEGRGISPEHFTFADVGSIKAMGFFYMVIGVFWFGGSLFAR